MLTVQWCNAPSISAPPILFRSVLFDLYHHSIGGENRGKEDRKLILLYQREETPPRREMPSAIGHLDRHPPARPCPLSAALHSFEIKCLLDIMQYPCFKVCATYLHVHVVVAIAFAVCCLTHPQGPFAAA